MSGGIVVGLTGQTGAGKSTAAALLREKGCAVVDADLAARAVTQPGSPVLPQLAAAFGPDILRHDGTLDRALLARRAFASAGATARLNAVTHPAITRLVRQQLDIALQGGVRAVILDAAALFESGEDALCACTAVVCAPEPVRLARILRRDGISRQAALERIRAQKPEAFYRGRADLLLRNYAPYRLEEELVPLLERIGMADAADAPVPSARHENLP